MTPAPLSFTGTAAVLDRPGICDLVLTLDSMRRTLTYRTPIYRQSDPDRIIGVITRYDAVRADLHAHGQFNDDDAGQEAARELSVRQTWPCILQVQASSSEPIEIDGAEWQLANEWWPLSLLMLSRATPLAASPTCLRPTC